MLFGLALHMVLGQEQLSCFYLVEEGYEFLTFENCRNRIYFPEEMDGKNLL